MDDLDDVEEIIKKIRELGSDAYVEETDDGEIVIRTGLARDEDTGDLAVIDSAEDDTDVDGYGDEDYDDGDEEEEEEED